MKNFTNQVSIYTLLFLLSFQQVLAADEPMVEKRKTYSKSYSISRNDRIKINNSFGEVKISTWGKNEVKVDVTVITNSSTDARAQELLDLVSIEDGKNGDGVFFRTVRKNDKKKVGNKNDYKNEDSKTNYQVFLPATSPLNLKNEFGPTILPDLNGQLEVESKFGSLTAGKLSNVKQLSVEFGSASVEAVKGSAISISFSRAIIENVEGNIKAKFEHCSGIKLGLENDLQELSINNNFSNLYLNVNKGLSAAFAITTSFGNFSNSTAFNIAETGDKTNKPGKQSRSYSGKAGNGTANIRINSDFGNVELGHNLSMHLKEDKKTTTKI